MLESSVIKPGMHRVPRKKTTKATGFGIGVGQLGRKKVVDGKIVKFRMCNDIHWKLVLKILKELVANLVIANRNFQPYTVTT